MNEREREIRWAIHAASGDRESLDLLLQSLQRPLYRYILGLAGQQALAEDVLQEVLLLVCRKVKWLREPALLRPWVYRIATRECWKRLAHERRFRDTFLSGDLPEKATGAPVQDAELLARLPVLVRQLSPASRAVVALHYLEELTIEETAAALGISAGTAKSRLAYGLACLRRLVADEGQPQERLREGSER